MRVWPARTVAGTAPAEGDEEASLVRRARAGDPEAFGALVRAHQDQVYRLALRMVGDESAEDIAQQGFISAWQGLAGFHGEARFGSWLYRITANLCLDELRRRARFRPMPLEEAPEIAAEGEPADDLIRRATASEQQATLDWALARLPDEDRLLLTLRVAEQQPYEAIATILGVRVGTVGSRLSRARGRLQALLRQRLKETP